MLNVILTSFCDFTQDVPEKWKMHGKDLGTRKPEMSDGNEAAQKV